MTRIPSARRAFGRVLRQLRKSRRFSQQELANLIPCDRQMIGNYERAENSPSLDMIARIAEALGIRLSELFVLVEKALPPKRK